MNQNQRTMKIQCTICEATEANVLCCADDAALCWSCDNKVHTVNNLPSKHQRVTLSDSSSSMPNCDICQKTAGHFFCMEDRALFCRKCDVAIHTVNSSVSCHQRFLLTSVKVGSVEVGCSNLGRNSDEGAPQAPVDNQPNQVSSVADVAGGIVTPAILPPCEGSLIDNQWLEDYLASIEFNQTQGLVDYNSLSKDVSGCIGHDSDCLPSLRSLAEEACLGHVGDTSWMVVP